MFEIVTVVNESPWVIPEADKYLDCFAGHNQYRILPAIVYKPALNS